MSLIRVDRVDSGVLYCAVTHVPAHVSAAHPQQPQVTAAEEHVAQAPGHAATLTCRVTAVPVPVITWHRVTAAGNISDEMNTAAAAGEAMMAVHSHGDTDIVISDYTDGVVTSSLVLGSVKAGDYGRYVCTATNGHGKVRFSPLANYGFYSYNVHT